MYFGLVFRFTACALSWGFAAAADLSTSPSQPWPGFWPRGFCFPGDHDAGLFLRALRSAASVDGLRTARDRSGHAASEDILLDDRVDAPVAVNHLGDAEVDADGDQRDCLILCQLLSHHQELAHLAERISQGEIDRRFRVDIGLRLGSQLTEVIGKTEAVHQPLVLSL